uniref:DRY_EERY domain-containing protein n=1 Tax=Caenorhabditis tropicalis TaxID=1561998 RepID=A0A1I7SZY0_9PELO
MWHEARRQEKILRTTMIDQSKRAERKRRYFENVRKDPEQFMQIHGRKTQIHADLSIARAAEDSNILRPWQGDSSITIDRFDARSHLSKADLIDDDDILPKKKKETVDEKEKIVTDFERYRVLIINDYKKVSEKSYLKKIADREFYHSEKEHSKKAEAEKKKKSADKKSQIGFSYDDSDIVRGGKGDKNDTDEESEEEEIDDMFDLDVDLDTSILNPETQRVVNKSGEEFGVKRGLFCALLKADQQALRDAAQLKQIDRQKAQLSGRDSKHERMLLRQQRQAIVGKQGMVVSENGATATLLGFINQSQKKSKIDEMIKDMEGSDDDDDRRAKPEFIRTFGGNADRDSDDEGKKNTVGPELPSEEYRKILNLSKNRRKDDDEKVDWGNLKFGGNDGMSRRSWSRSRSSSRSRSPPRRSRSRSRSRDRYRRRRSGSRRRRSISRDRRRSRSRDRRRSRSRDRRRSRSRDRRRGSSRTRYRGRSSSRRRHRSKDRRRNRSREDRNEKRRRTRSKERKEEVKIIIPESVPEEKPVVQIDEPKESSAEESGNEDIKMLEIRSSMSDSEKEKIEIENRKRRVKLTKKLVKEKRGQPSTAEDRSSDEEDEEQQRKSEQARRVKQQMSQALKKTRQEMAKEEEERKREAIVAQKVRDELRYIEIQERRERERAKLRQSDIPLPPSP